MTVIIVRDTQIIAAEINSIKEQTRKIVLGNSIEIGRKLAEAKQIVAHGEWGKWLQESVDYSQSTANNLMKIFEEYGADQLSLFGDNSKSQALGNLSYTQAVALLGVPSEEREDFVKDNKIDEMSTRELQQAIKDKQELEKKLKAVEEAAKKESLAYETLKKSNEELQTKTKAHDEQVKNLNEDLTKAQALGDNMTAKKLKADLDKVKKDLADSVKKAKELEEQLKKKPIDVPATIKEDTDETKLELERLRQAELAHSAQLKVKEEEAEKQIQAMQEQLTKNNNTETIKVKVSLAALVDNFKALLAAVEEVNNPDEKAKFKSDIPILCDRLKGMVV